MSNGHLLRIWTLALIPASMAVGYLSAEPVVAALWILAIVLSVPLLLGRATLLDYLVVSMPLMFYAGSLHVALSDALLPFMAVGTIMWTKRAPVRLNTAFVSLALLALFAAGSSALFASYRIGFDISLAGSNVLKLAVVLAYTLVIASHVSHLDVRLTFRALRVWAWTAAVQSVGSVIGMLGAPTFVPTSGDGWRSEGFFQDPNYYAGYLLLSLAVIFARESFKPCPETPFLLLAVSGGVVATASRSALATLIVLLLAASVLLTLRAVRFALIPAGIASLWLVVQVVTGGTYSQSIPALGRLTESTTRVGEDPRFALWGRALELWAESPVFGIGIGQYGLYSEDAFQVSGRTGTGFVAHNTFLSFLAETGVVGLSVWLLGLAGLALMVHKAQLFNRNVRWSIQIGICAVVLQMMTLNLQNLRYVWVFFGIVVGLCMISSSSSRVAQTEVEPMAYAPAHRKRRGLHYGKGVT